jgi:hypothetical protein
VTPRQGLRGPCERERPGEWLLEEETGWFDRAAGADHRVRVVPGVKRSPEMIADADPMTRP